MPLKDKAVGEELELLVSILLSFISLEHLCTSVIPPVSNVHFHSVYSELAISEKITFFFSKEHLIARYFASGII